MTAEMTITPTCAMRPGLISDREQVRTMVRERAAWMRAHGQERWTTWDRGADALAKQVGDPTWPTWVLVTDADEIVGVTTASRETPQIGWTEQEQSERALFLQTTVTHPRYAGHGLGIVIAFWALDYAACEGMEWVRRGVLTIGDANRGLVRYYRQQGWRVVHAVPHPRKAGVTVWSLQRSAERQPDLPLRITSTAASVATA
jgi:GNAT superfamily N-acetyltransferase